MKAAIIVTHGGVEGLEIREVDTPPMPTADRVRVRVRAAGLNRADILQRQGYYPAPVGAPKDIPGLEFAGEVAEVIGARESGCAARATDVSRHLLLLGLFLRRHARFGCR